MRRTSVQRGGLWTGGALLALALGLPGCGDGDAPGGDGTAVPGSEAALAASAARLRSDRRLGWLLAPCSRSRHYDVNTADVLAILARTLEAPPKADSLRRTKTELASLGAEGMTVALRQARTHWNRPEGKNHVRNAIDVALQADEAHGRPLLEEAVLHPEEDLRLLAIEGLARYEDPGDWELLEQGFQLSSSTFAPRVVASLFRSDPARTAHLVLDWVEAGQFELLWSEVLPAVSAVTDAEVVERCRALWPRLPVAYGLWLCAPCARAGDPEAIEALEEWATHDDATIRGNTIVALGRAELLDGVARILREDPSAENRALAASTLAATPSRVKETREALRAGCSDGNDDVVLTCLRALADAGDEPSIDRGLAMLTANDGADTRTGLRVLSEAFRNHDGLAERALAQLTAELERQAHRPLSERSVLYVTVGRLPLEAAAEYLMEARDAHAGETVQGLTASNWFALQAGNVGVAAHPALLAELGNELDPVRRLDLLEGLSTRGEPEARDVLLALIEEDALSPYEVLYAADRLVRIGPTSAVAPALKRATLRIDQDDVRLALQCLLWQSYPGPG